MADEEFKDVAQKLNRLNTITQQLNKFSGEIGSNGDDSSLRDDLKRLRDEGQGIVKSSREILERSHVKSQKAKHLKVKTQCDELTTNFEKAAKITIKREIDYQRKSMQHGAGAGASSSNQSQYHQQQQQQQQQHYGQQNVDSLIVEETNQEMRQLEKELQELTEVMKDMKQLTDEQGEDLVTVQQNTSSASIRVEEGRKELVKANRYACSYRKKLAAIAVILIVVVAIIIIVVVTTATKNKNKEKQ
eukprot:TRINITY_DN2169_c0_g1_i1.p1 TRINITY_DN2169_c0_g1~~TRINITY_DN2169_c0_g1_i1.p1  ORF type:complete len:246 (+),score=61.94 TRINITY_DN2169_c0_g1_i1:86-823(+)